MSIPTDLQYKDQPLIIVEVRTPGVTSLGRIAKALNERGIRTPRGRATIRSRHARFGADRRLIQRAQIGSRVRRTADSTHPPR